MILVTGCTGTTGTELLKELSRLGAKTRAFTRKKTARIDLPHIEQFVGDLSRPETIPPALSGVQSAFLLTPPGQESGQLQANFVNAAKKARLPYLVKLSAFGSALDSPCRFLRQHAEAESRIEDSGVPFTFLRPAEFMQNLILAKETIVSQGAFYAPQGEGRVNLVDVRDVAAVAARVLTEHGHAGHSYGITGPEAVSNSRVAEALSQALQRPIRYVNISPDAYRQSLLQVGLPQWTADGVIELYDIWRNNGATEITNVVETVGRKKPNTIEQFANDYIPAFLGQAAARG